MTDSSFLRFEPPLPAELEVTPELVSAAYKRALRFGLYWRLKPEERAVLTFARKLRAIKSLVLREIIFKILERVWPEKARSIRAITLGTKLLAQRVSIALKINAVSVARAFIKMANILAPQLGYTYLNMPLPYRPKIEAEGII